MFFERHLARAGSGAGDRRRIDVNECLQGLIGLMQTLHAARDIDWQLDVPGRVFWRGKSTDLEEMLGNLLDNAGNAHGAYSVYSEKRGYRYLNMTLLTIACAIRLARPGLSSP